MSIQGLFRRLNAKVTTALAEDFRKVGTYIIGLGAAAIVIPNDGIEIGSSVLLIIFGLLNWIVGLLFTYINTKLNDKE